MSSSDFRPSRRQVVGAGALLAAPLIWPGLARAAAPAGHALRPGTAASLDIGLGQAPMAVWSYDGTVPGPELRVKRGERIAVAVTNDLAEPTTVHWHGLRLPNAMDGVAYLTQPPIEPGATFDYAFEALDAGTFWYHPHIRSSEQVGRGLYGVLVVEEDTPAAVDRDLTLVIDDWRIGADGQLTADFEDLHDAAHGGQIGNVATLNGRAGAALDVRAGERLRLRLVNTANARIIALEFAGHSPILLARDGHPVRPRGIKAPIVLGPGMRADIVLDMTGAAGERFAVIDRFYGPQTEIGALVYGPQALRRERLGEVAGLPANPVGTVDLDRAERRQIVLGGGMMGNMGMGPAMTMGAGPGGHMDAGHGAGIWTVNGTSVLDHTPEPLAVLSHGRSYVVEIVNDTRWHHPMHLHGHVFRIVSRAGKLVDDDAWLDTALLAPDETVEIALVADNPGDWMLHCHVLGHQATGMMGVIRVA